MRYLKINGVENQNYRINEFGEVWNKEGKLLTQFETNNGYLRVKLSRGCKRGMYLVHRLVAEVFVPNPENHNIVHHKDGDRLNNRFDNLEWCTNSHNQKERYKANSLTGNEVPVDQYTMNKIFIRRFSSMKEAEKVTGVANQNISKVCRGERNFAGGYFWKYSDFKSCVETTETEQVVGI